MTRIRTLNFLPEIFQTETNSQFLAATLDQLVNPSDMRKIEGYVGSKIGYGVNSKDNYVTEPTKVRRDYQLAPGVVFTKENETTAKDFLSYPGIIDAVKVAGGVTDDNSRLFESQFYSWDSFVNLDKVVNYNQYYWLPDGPPAVTVSTGQIFLNSDFEIQSSTATYDVTNLSQGVQAQNPTITLLRGGTYNFIVDQSTEFWIQGEPGTSGKSATQPNLNVRDVFGVTNNGENVGIVTFNVPASDAQSEYNLPGNNIVDVISTISYAQLNGALLSTINNIDGVTSLNGLTVLFYNTGSTNPLETSNFYTITYSGSLSNPTIQLVPAAAIPSGERIVARFGTTFINLAFFKNTSGVIEQIPYITADRNTLYYQDGTTASKVGIIKIVENNSLTSIDVEADILGRTSYTSPNQVVFTNGLKVIFEGEVFPESYRNNQYYVEGVGSSIKLIPVSSLTTPEDFTASILIPFDTTPFDATPYDGASYLPVQKDYITIARDAINKNAWSRSNRWFHYQVIADTANYNNNPSILTSLATAQNKANRPIIEFYPNLRLFNSGTEGKNAIDFIDFRTTDAFTQVAGQENYYPDVQVYTSYSATIAPAVGTSTTITVNRSAVTGTFAVGQYISDSTNQLPVNTTITSISGTSTLTLTVSWASSTTIAGASNASLIANDENNSSFALFDGARIVFAADTNASVRNKIYVASFSTLAPSTTPVITLSEAPDGTVLLDNQLVVLRGYNYQGKSFYFGETNTGIAWLEAQQKVTVNQPPLFDVFDKNNISLGNKDIYTGSSFQGSKLFGYAIGSGPDDPVLGFPIQYSSITNVGDINFEVSFNKEKFNYVVNNEPKTENVNTGYVFDYISREAYSRKLGWQTALAPSVQYQIFEFDYDVNNPLNTFVCDIAALPGSDSSWPTVQVYKNNVFVPYNLFTVEIGTDTTTVDYPFGSDVDTKVQIFVLSNQVSKTAYYGTPINLNNNPFNTNIESADLGDIRSHYQSICINNQNLSGPIIGPNNYRDLGNMVPYGTMIIQNSASLVLPAAFMRRPNYNLIDALMYNSREYIKFKNVLIDAVSKIDLTQRFDPATLLDTALENIASIKNQEQPFFWSDMLPSRSPYLTSLYTFANALSTSIFPLSKVYDFKVANYNGVLVYVTRTTDGITFTKQLVINVDYTVSETSPSLTVTFDLQPNDTVTIKEYNQTYGSFAPNTPTKLGLYPASIPAVVLDTNYLQPTYFIKGHDGSYNKLYGDYDPNLGILIDFRDQALLEFETRVYNNLKLSNTIPIKEYEVVPGFFRTTDYSYPEWLDIYSITFLDWIGQNRLDFKRQLYNTNDQYTYNYSGSSSKLSNQALTIGNWRGLYQYFYDTTTPNTTPWEMLGFTNEPSWWTNRYGPAPYTSNNLVLWNDLAEGINYNDGNPVVIEQAVRPGLLDIIPVDAAGELRAPLSALIGRYNPNSFQRDWKVGDAAPVEFSYRRSSSYPFDLMRLLALTKPANFFNLGVDLDNYKYNEEFNQYLVNDRSHLVIDQVQIYGNGTAKTSYINWIVDYEKQLGLGATESVQNLLKDLDVRLVYRLAGFSDKSLLKFFVEKGTPNNKNASLLIPDENYSVLLYENQPTKKLVYSSVIVQIVNDGYMVFGNSQTNAYFKTLKPLINNNMETITIERATVKVAKDYSTIEEIVPYNTVFYTLQEVSQFLMSYGKYLESQGMIFDQIINAIEVNWPQMVAEFLYWSQIGWEIGSITDLNPAANTIKIDPKNLIVQPLTFQQTNFILNANLYPIQTKDLAIVRDGTLFTAQALNQGDTVAYGQFNLSNFEHGIVFDNLTVFDDVIYNLVTGLRQFRVFLSGYKSAEWNGTVTISGFIYNQDNVKEWQQDLKYTKGSIVLYKNKYWTALKLIQPSQKFNEIDWKETEYREIQKGLLPNSSTRSYESTLYYNVDKANLELDADLLSFSLIGFRPRPYMAAADLTDITQVNVYKNFIRTKGTKNSVDAFKGASLPQGGIEYQVYENWAIKTSEFGGVLNNNFIELKLNQSQLTANPSIVSLTNGVYTEGADQEVPVYSLFNYARPITDPNVLTTIPYAPSALYPDAGYVNFNDVKMSSFLTTELASAVNKNGIIVPIDNLYVRDYVWIADFKGTWQVLTPTVIGQVLLVRNNLNGTATVTFNKPHNLTKLQTFGIVNFNPIVNGYYNAQEIVNPTQVIISAVFNSSTRQVTGEGTAFAFTVQRVASPADINNLPLVAAEFTKNTVWTDTNQDGSWAVFRKSLNYQYNSEISPGSSLNFGSAVAYEQNAEYLIGDSELGQVYRYRYNAITQGYDLDQTITQGSSFGAAIAYAERFYAIAEPTGTPKVYLYTINNSTLSDDMVLYQPAINAPMGVLDWGSALAVSQDGNWLFISDKLNNKVHVYQKQNILLDAGYFVVGETYTITNVGNTDFTLLGAIENKAGITFIATGAGTIGETGQATQITFKAASVIDASASLLSDELFGSTVTTNYYGNTVVIGAPQEDTSAVTYSGKAYVYARNVQNIEAQQTTAIGQAQRFLLALPPTTVGKVALSTNATGNVITLNNTTSVSINDPIIFSGNDLLNTGISQWVTYYVRSVSGSDITIKTSRSSSTAVQITTKAGPLSITATVQKQELLVMKNGQLVLDNNYGVVGSQFVFTGSLSAGDILTVNDSQFTKQQELTAGTNIGIGERFGSSVSISRNGSQLVVSSPFETNGVNQEGVVYCFTNAGARYGTITGTATANVTVSSTLLLNGYAVTIPAGNAQTAASAINLAKLTNIQAADSAGTLVISVIDQNIALANEKLNVTAINSQLLTELGISTYTQTQIINCPHIEAPTQFGAKVKFNEHDSFIVSAPVGTRYSATTFDFTDDENQDNDTVFDNNATQFLDSYQNAGAVYMFDYLPVYNESLNNLGAFVYAQSVNAQDQEFGYQPKYGSSIDFNQNKVIVGAVDFGSGKTGQAVIYENYVGVKDWSVFRESAPIVDINRIQNLQIFSAQTNNTLENLDYFDPLQGKLLGAVRQNIDVVSNIDPSGYNNAFDNQKKLIWGPEQVGQLWFNTSAVRFVNYHQNNDVKYNAKYWGTVFPGSDPAVYTWVASNVPPDQYQGPGTPFDTTRYVVQGVLDATGLIVPVYYFWARNTNTIATKRGKTLADTVLEQYLLQPQSSGISYLAPLLPNSFALYNSQQYVNANDSVLHVGYSTGQSEDVAHSEFNLIRADFADDFLPGLPGQAGLTEPFSLYDRMLDSLSGVDEAGQIVPNPFLPKAVQSGILARPRQSFFYNRFGALKNYLTYANAVLKQFPVAESRVSRYRFLFEKGDVNPSTVNNPEWPNGPQLFYDTTKYWDYVNWWAVGYDDSTKPSLLVQRYADLATLNVATGTLVAVASNANGNQETYRFDGDAANPLWTLIGIQNGTISFKSVLWDYPSARLGWGDNFYDTTVFDFYPSEETRWIIRALNEQIFVDDLLIFRNKSLILLFEYIQSETIESQNFLPWLNKTSLVDVEHKIRELIPIQTLQVDNQEFLAGYINEVKPYHVLIKDFLFSYTGIDTFGGDITDFDLPAQYNPSIGQFVTPELVYSNASGYNQFLPTSDIWNNPEYVNWFQNRGLSLAGQPNYLIAELQSYVTLGSNFLYVNNAAGFPINGLIKIGQELIAYNSVDTALNMLSGLVRGVNGTQIAVHIPGENIFIDLPPVVLYDGGRAYTNPPKVTAYIDLTKYPAPTTEARLQAVMDLDKVVGIEVVTPGTGYAVTPEIVIEPSITVLFESTGVFPTLDVIRLSNNFFETGDLVKYVKGAGTNVGGLANNQWYYVRVLQTVPNAVIALYTTYSDAINDTDRVDILSTGTGNDHQLQLGAKASAITSAAPVRENIITMRFDRTTYTSQVTDWEAGRFYGSFFAGDYNNSQDVSSSSIKLQSNLPPVSNIFASAQGVVFEISNVENKQEVTFSQFERAISETIATGNIIRLDPFSTVSSYASGSTVGFYVGMPVKFVGAVVGGLVNNQVYYVESVVNETDFTVSTTEGGPAVSLTSATVSLQGLKCFTAAVTNTAVLTVNYPNIRNIISTQANTNIITAPFTEIGTGGTQGFYTNLPVEFVGTEFGDLVSNKIYYVISVLDGQRFTVGETPNPLMIDVVSTTTGTNLVTVDAGETTNSLAVNMPVVFSNMVVSGNAVSTFGNIVANTIYYVREIVSTSQFTLTTSENGPVFALSNQTGTLLLTSQAGAAKVTTATGNMTMNVALPVSPGQVDKQYFTLYQTSNQFANITSVSVVNSSLISANVSAARLATNILAIEPNSGDLGFAYAGMPIQFDSSIGGLSANTTYTIAAIGDITANVSASYSANNRFVADSTNSMYVGMPFKFNGSAFGNVVIGDQYYVEAIASTTEFSITDVPGDPALPLTTDSGIMSVDGPAYITANVAVSANEIKTVRVMQEPSASLEFDVSYILGGYRVIINDGGQGFAVNNEITINGSLIGGNSGTNDLTMQVNSIDSQGTITDVICSGTPNGQTLQAYLKVVSANKFEVYQDKQCKIPVSGIGFDFVGFTSTAVSATALGTNLITVADTTSFNLYDPVVFTGSTFGNLIAGKTYYVLTIPSTTTLTVSDNPGGNVIPLTTATGSAVMAKAGSYAFLPEPFTYNQSIVRYNNNVYVCVVSNNDDEFILGKWALLRSDDRRLNALDRIVGYYTPTANMPGLDLAQLVSNIVYPNATYLGNSFDPAQQFTLDIDMQGQPFYPTNVDLVAVTHDGNGYISVANLPDYSALIAEDSGNWNIAKFANVPLSFSSLEYTDNAYFITARNFATPIFKSFDGAIWSPRGLYTTDINLPWTSSANNTIELASAGLSMNKLAYQNGIYVAVGNEIVSSNDAIIWRQTYQFTSGLPNYLYGVAAVSIPSFTGFVAVGKGQRIDSSSGLAQIVDTNIILYSNDGINWSEVPSLTTKGMFSVTADATQIIAVGQDGIIYRSNNGANWSGINETQVLSVNGVTDILSVASTIGLQLNDVVRFSQAFDVVSINTDYYVVNIINATQIQISLIASGPVVNLVGSGAIPSQTLMFKSPQTLDLNDVAYGNLQFLAVGSGNALTSLQSVILTSGNGISWTSQTSNVETDLRSATYLASANTWTVVGDDNTVIQSTDAGNNWVNVGAFTVAPPVYEIQGEPFQYGYGPEELVPGYVSDNLNMIVTTRPGTNWPAAEYAHVGYNVVSLQLTPTSGTQTEYSFYDAVQTPAQLSVFLINGTTNVSTSLYEGLDYTVDWVNQKVVLNNPISFLPIADNLRIDVYEVGNGDQLVKSNTENDPLRTNVTTGFNEIILNCNYSATRNAGGGVVKPSTFSVTTTATATDSTDNTITCDDVSKFTLNQPIVFTGVTFGNIAADTTYYVKSISVPLSAITVSDTLTGGGVAGPEFILSTATGTMQVVLNAGSGILWTSPIVLHNGTKLVLGAAGSVSRTRASDNRLTCISTLGMLVGDPIVFDTQIFGGVAAQTVYYIESIPNLTQFTISTSQGGSVFALSNATGRSTYVTRGYAIAKADNLPNAKIVFAEQYDQDADYLTYTLFTETIPVQYGFTLPETQVFAATGNTVFTLNNYVGNENVTNAIVEVEGLRVDPASYTIDPANQTLTFTSGQTGNVAITSFGDTARQYLTTNVDIGTTNTVANIINVINTISPPLAITNITNTTAPSVITATTTANFIENQPVVFKGTGFGTIATNGTIYFVRGFSSSSLTIGQQYRIASLGTTDWNVVAGTIGITYNIGMTITVAATDPGTGTAFGLTTFQIAASPTGSIINTLTTAAGLMVAVVGGSPAVRIETGIPHNLSTNDLIRIDGITGSVELNNNLYYVQVIDAECFYIYETPYQSGITDVNNPVTAVSSYVSGGYAWLAGSWTLVTTTATATTTGTNLITVGTTIDLRENTPVLFTEPGQEIGNVIMGGLVVGQTYYIKDIVSGTEFSISETRGGNSFVLSTDTGSVNVTQWEQLNTARLWVTVNGYRVPDSKLRLNAANDLSILAVIQPGDDIIITSMIPSATPNSETFMLMVNKNNEGKVYRSNPATTTWLTQSLTDISSTIYVNDVRGLTNTVVQNVVCPAITNGVYTIGLNADKTQISSIKIYNNTTAQFLDQADYQLTISATAPEVVIDPGAYITAGDSLTITTLVGNILYVNGEQIRFSVVNEANNTLSGLTRGVNGTGVQTLIPKFTTVYSLLNSNLMSDIDYNKTWNSYTYNTVDGDPLQISTTTAAEFLRVDVT